MIPKMDAKGLAHLVTSVVLAAVIGLGSAALSDGLAADNVQVAAASAAPTSLDQCVRSQAPAAAIVEACTKVLESTELLGTDRAVALYSRGCAYGAMGESARARSDLLESADQYTALMSSWSPAPALLYSRALVWHALGDADRAIADYDLVAKMAPTEPLVFLNRGILLAGYRQQYRLALIDFDQVLALKPKDPKVAYRAAKERAVALAAIGATRAQEQNHGAASAP